MEEPIPSFKEFRITPEGMEIILKSTKKRLLYIGLPLIIIVITVTLIMLPSITQSNQTDIGQQPSIVIYSFMIPLSLFIFILFYVYSRQIKQSKRAIENYRLTLTTNSITRHVGIAPDITLDYRDITEIVNHQDYFISVKGHSKFDIIYIARQIENYEVLEVMLNNIKPITVKPSLSFYQRYGLIFTLLFGLIGLGQFWLFFATTNKIVAGITGTTLFISFIYSCYTIVKNKNIDHRTKKMLWFALPFLFFILFNTYYKIFAMP